MLHLFKIPYKLPAQTEISLITAVFKKIGNYEKSPPTRQNYPVHCLSSRFDWDAGFHCLQQFPGVNFCVPQA